MGKRKNFKFNSNYKIRFHMFFVIKRIIATEIAIALIAFTLNLIISSGGNILVETSNTLYMGVFFLGINLIMFLYYFLSWNYSYYMIFPKRISFTTGLIFKKNQSIDIAGIRSVAVTQGLLGKLLNYGTIILESPVLTNKFVMHNIPNAFGHAELIDKTRLKAIETQVRENIIISQ